MPRLFVVVPWSVKSIKRGDRQVIVGDITEKLRSEDIFLLYVNQSILLESVMLFAIFEKLKVQVIFLGPVDCLLTEMIESIEAENSIIQDKIENLKAKTEMIIQQFLAGKLNPALLI